jgi:DNA-binding transcriptional regulator YiaG
MTAFELRIAIDALGLTQSSLARTLEVSRRQVVNWAAGTYPVPVTVALLLNLMLTTGSTAKDLYLGQRRRSVPGG